MLINIISVLFIINLLSNFKKLKFNKQSIIGKFCLCSKGNKCKNIVHCSQQELSPIKQLFDKHK